MKNLNPSKLEQRLSDLLPANFTEKSFSPTQVRAITATVENLLAEENE